MHDHPDAPRDLDSNERVVAAWFQALDRPDAPAGLREAVLARGPGQVSASQVSASQVSASQVSASQVSASQVSASQVSASQASEASPRRPAGRLLRMVPFGAWGIASAALILVAFGAAVAVELTAPVPGASRTVTPVAGVETDSSFIVRRDQTLSLYHDLEIFDEVGLPQGEVLADWGR